VLQEREFQRLGGTRLQKANVRVIAATLRDLDDAVKTDRFRADLFNRLAGWRVDVAPLRDRRDDVVAIAQTFVARRGGPPLSADAAEALVLHDWPGNVRELEREITVAVVRATATRASEIGLCHLPPAFANRLTGRPMPTGSEIEMPIMIAPQAPVPTVMPTRDELCAMLEKLDGNIARVAEHYGKDRQQVYRWARRYGIDLDIYRSA